MPPCMNCGKPAIAVQADYGLAYCSQTCLAAVLKRF
jgi:endogenous inhibitor of DNA gyrase (YacG/DUF329 family)